MKKQILTIIAVAGLTLFTMTSAVACSVAGPNKHVGQVTAVNVRAGTFTIMDAETRKPIVFAASADILKDVAKAKGSVLVSYVRSKGRLVAREVHF